MQIRYLKAEEIDKTKWNSCVHYANNGNVFGYMWYLNNVAKNWDALVENDYESVLPLIWQPKILKTKAVYLPQLVRSTGIYSVNVLSKKRVNAFLNAIPKDFQNIEIALNDGILPSEELDFEIEKKENFQLLLNKDYESIALDYVPATNDLITQAAQLKWLSTSNLKPEVLADFYKKHTTETIDVNKKYHALQRIMYNAMHRGIGFASGIQNKKGETLAADFFIFSHGKLLSLLGTVSKEDQHAQAYLLLLDRMIQTNARRPVILDLNNHENWLKGLGAKPVSYFHIKRKKGWRKFL